MISVSIVDDEKKLCKSIATFLNGSTGFRCLSIYGSAEAALKQLPTDNPDVVLMDINMAGMDGIECVKQLKILAPQIQILMLTVYEDTIFINREHQYLYLRCQYLELFDTFNPIHARHIDIHQHHVRIVRWKLFQCCLGAPINAEAAKSC